MPELPDVEGFRRVLAEHAVRRRIEDVEVRDAQVLRGVGARRLRDVLVGQRFAEPRRLGKWLVAPVAGRRETVVLHFGMTGSLRWESGEPHPHDRVIFHLRGGQLRYRDMRKLQGLRLAEDEAALERVLDGTGPDALEVPKGRFRELLPARRQVKVALTDQAVLAGLGNLLADEILWRARINPRTPVADLAPADVDRLHARMRSTLRSAVRAERVPPRPSWLTGRRDEPSGTCPRCGTALSHARVGGRGTVWCPHCQPG
ncbi:formamidopyrimidine-DNA glycosylase [Amycolatopsis bartoniae]|uniref:Formamidopyrimidine-DNA glycosylase n=1 Tax=Amycolatopsis bartoniae TaxID=941986 RepID=A0A8H9MD03_9PSEU|nr:DNA-formamidopyrimidine glycosylase family protein [Amycolatopsis bartoniae]MBB2935404.1 formamidopyrimidine-DNA glycosylase [Amycolatopsis bartoniae]TVT03726.1 Fpg/Nei family DNA glycosylase [Amycolatopsis bartoniae]GHF75840.1 formamidopyrimidine-DNA glycosylase [Amycolatopsis bartoniae]